MRKIMKTTYEGIEVSVLHQGFDIVIIQFDNGLQKCVNVEETTLKKRYRPKVFKY